MSAYPGEPAPVGVLGQVAIALIALDLPTVTRSTLRAVLPPGELRDATPERIAARRARGNTGAGRVNKTSLNFTKALKRLEDDGYLRRTESTVEDIDRPALARYVAETWGNAPAIPYEYAATLTALLNGKHDPQSEREIAALRRVMQQAPTRRGRGRLVHRSHL